LLSNYIGDYNDDVTRKSITSQLCNILDQYLVNRQLTDYLVVCDESNNLPREINLRMLTVDIYFKERYYDCSIPRVRAVVQLSENASTSINSEVKVDYTKAYDYAMKILK